jgi:hypothetical protein
MKQLGIPVIRDALKVKGLPVNNFSVKKLGGEWCNFQLIYQRGRFSLVPLGWSIKNCLSVSLNK